MKSKNRPLILVLVLALGSCFTYQSFAQSSWLADEKYLTDFDVYSFASGHTQKTFVEVYCHLSTKWLQFIRWQDGFKAEYLATLVVKNTEGTVIESHSIRNSIQVKTFWEIDEPRPAHTLRFAYLLPPAPYTFSLQVQDPETGEVLRLEKDVSVESFEIVEPCISSVVVASSVVPAACDGPLVKFNREIHPNVTKMVAAETDSIHLYAEVYGATAYGQTNLELVMHDKKGNIVQHRNTSLPTDLAGFCVTAGFDISTLRPGKYKITLRLYRQDKLVLHKKSTSFTILQPEAAQVEYSTLLQFR